MQKPFPGGSTVVVAVEAAELCPMHSALESLRSALEPLLREQLSVPLTEKVYCQLAFYAVIPCCITLKVGISCCGPCGAGFEVCGAEVCVVIGP
jgi:regulation of enolase protein 1 (concanavalin A-like superfamily)